MRCDASAQGKGLVSAREIFLCHPDKSLLSCIKTSYLGLEMIKYQFKQQKVENIHSEKSRSSCFSQGITNTGSFLKSVQNLCWHIATNYSGVNGIEYSNWFRSLDLHQIMSEMSENKKYRNELLKTIKDLKMKD